MSKSFFLYFALVVSTTFVYAEPPTLSGPAFDAQISDLLATKELAPPTEKDAAPGTLYWHASEAKVALRQNLKLITDASSRDSNFDSSAQRAKILADAQRLVADSAKFATAGFELKTAVKFDILLIKARQANLKDSLKVKIVQLDEARRKAASAKALVEENVGPESSYN